MVEARLAACRKGKDLTRSADFDDALGSFPAKAEESLDPKDSGGVSRRGASRPRSDDRLSARRAPAQGLAAGAGGSARGVPHALAAGRQAARRIARYIREFDAALCHRQYPSRGSWAGCMAAARRSACSPKCSRPASTPICGGRDHIADRGRAADRPLAAAGSSAFPRTPRGLFVTGTSMANLLAVLVARTGALGGDVRQRRLCAEPGAARRLCLGRGAWLHRAGHGLCRPRQRRAAPSFRSMTTTASTSPRCARAIAADRAAGLDALPRRRHRRHGRYRRDRRPCRRSPTSRGAKSCGSMSTAPSARSAILSPELRRGWPGSSGRIRIALDFHKWGQVPYDAGFVLVRDGALHRDTFAAPAAYLRREPRGLAAARTGPAISGRTSRAASAR